VEKDLADGVRESDRNWRGIADLAGVARGATAPLKPVTLQLRPLK
jgi:hypothetical protein